MVADLYPKHMKEDPATVILGMTVEFDRSKKLAYIKQEAAVLDLLNSIFKEWDEVDLNLLPKVPLPVPPRNLSKRDQELMKITLPSD